MVLATGTKPAVNAKVPINGRNIISSDQILSMPQIPRTLIVVGGGVIGVEYACMFATLGVRVIIVEKRPRLLEFADTEMVEALMYHLRDHRATLRLNEEVESVEELPDGKVAANLVSKKRVIADALLYAVGRAGNVDELNLAAANIVGGQPRAHRGGCGFSDRAEAYFCGGRCDRVSQPGVGFDGAGANCERAGVWIAGAQRSGGLSVRDLYHSADFVYREDRRTTDGDGCAV